MKPVHKSRPAAQLSLLAVELILIIIGAVLLDWYLLTS